LGKRPIKEEFEKEKKKKHSCPDCGKGELTILELIGKIFESCNLCGYRKKISG
jgi:ribosomal protein L37AE/L43A